MQNLCLITVVYQNNCCSHNSVLSPACRIDLICHISLLTKKSLSFCRGSRVPCRGSRVPCRGSRVTFFFSNFFLEKVIIDAINVIKTNKKNLKNKWRVNIFQLLGGGGRGWNREKLRDIPICFRRITFITPRKPIPRTEHVT